MLSAETKSVDLSPGSPAWASRVSPSKAAAILGISPWDSQRSIWHKLRGEVPWDAETEAMERGTLCEPAVLGWWRRHHEHTDWAEQASMTVGDWLVATPDAVCLDGDGERVIVEAKTSSNDADWGDPGTDAIPAYYLTQCYLAGRVAVLNGYDVKRIHVPLLGPRLRFANYVVEYDDHVGADLEARMRAFYDTLAAEVPPPLDDTLATYDAVRKVHPDIDAKAQVEVTEFEAVELLSSVIALDAIEASVRLAKSTVLDRMGRANYAVHNGVRVARRQANKSGVSFVPLPKNLPLLTAEMENAS